MSKIDAAGAVEVTYPLIPPGGNTGDIVRLKSVGPPEETEWASRSSQTPVTHRTEYRIGGGPATMTQKPYLHVDNGPLYLLSGLHQHNTVFDVRCIVGSMRMNKTYVRHNSNNNAYRIDNDVYAANQWKPLQGWSAAGKGGITAWEWWMLERPGRKGWHGQLTYMEWNQTMSAQVLSDDSELAFEFRRKNNGTIFQINVERWDPTR